MTNTRISSTNYGYEISKSYLDDLLKGKTNKEGHWDKNNIKYLLQTNDRMVIASLLKMYNYQTEEEQLYSETKDSNGVGFNAFDAEILSKIAEQIINKLFISAKQVKLVRNKIIKYSNQIAKIARGEV